MVKCDITVGEQCDKTLSSCRDALVYNSCSPDLRMINMSHYDQVKMRIVQQGQSFHTVVCVYA